MKKILIMVAFSVCCKILHAQIGLGITTPHPNAYFQVNSTTKGVLLPRMTALQRLAITPAPTANGLIVFDTDSSAYMFWTGAVWKKMGGDDGNWIKNGNDIYNSNTGNVGIGTNNPKAKLHVADSAVVFSSSVFNPLTISAPPIEGSGVRMMWYPQKAAFRAGLVDDGSIYSIPGLFDNKVWDKDSIGLYSFAAGFNSKAKGDGDVVMGQFNESVGGASALFGVRNKSYGLANFCTGFDNTANGNYNTIFGEHNSTSGNFSVAIGKNNTMADSSIAIGTGNLGQSILFGGHGNIALGNYNDSYSGRFNTAIGFANTLDNDYSIAVGYKSTAFGKGAIAMGVESYAGGDYAAALGYKTVSHAKGCVSVGFLNNDNYTPADDSTDRIFQIGNGNENFGIDFPYRSNAITVLRSGNVGIGTETPSATLHIAGSFKFENGTESLGRVLTLGGQGYANWEDLPPNFWSAAGTHIYNSNTGNVGIGNNNPISPLSFASTLGDKISLWGNNTTANYGFGIQAGTLQIHAATPIDNIAFGTGSSTSFAEVMRVQGNGLVGIGIPNPAFRLDVAGRIRIRNEGGQSAGTWYNNTANTNTVAFAGLENDNSVGFYGAGSGWNFTMNTNTGKIKIADGTQAAGRILSCDATGTASWVNSIAITSAVNGVFAGGGVHLTTAMGSAYMNAYIDLPPGKFIVLGTYLLSQGGSGGALQSGQSMWVRTSFSGSAAANINTGDIIGSALMSGSIGYSYPYGIINGQTIINNTSGATKRYFVWGNMTNSGGEPAGFALDGFGSSFWSENQLTAIPMN